MAEQNSPRPGYPDSSLRHRTSLFACLAALIWTALANSAAAQAPSAAGSGEIIKVQLIPSERAPAPPNWLEWLSNTAQDEKFLQNVFLLVATALVTGIGVPFVKSAMDWRYFKLQKEHEAGLTRQSNLIKEQTESLKKYAELLWQYQFVATKLTFAKANDYPEEQLRSAASTFVYEGWDVLQRLRENISSSVHLVDKNEYIRLVGFYYRIVSIDSDLIQRIDGTLKGEQGELREVDWGRYHYWLHSEWPWEIDEEIAALARAMKLEAGEPTPRICQGGILSIWYRESTSAPEQKEGVNVQSRKGGVTVRDQEGDFFVPDFAPSSRWKLTKAVGVESAEASAIDLSTFRTRRIRFTYLRQDGSWFLGVRDVEAIGYTLDRIGLQGLR